MMTEKLKIGQDQNRNVFNNFKRTIRDMSKLTNEQLAKLHYEAFHEAFVRSGGVVEPDES